MKGLVICDVDGTVTAPVLCYQQFETKSRNSHNSQTTYSEHPEYPFKVFDQYNKEAVDILNELDMDVEFISAGRKGWDITWRWATHFGFKVSFTPTRENRIQCCRERFSEYHGPKFYIGDSTNDIETVKVLQEENPSIMFAAVLNPLTLPLVGREVRPTVYLSQHLTLLHFANVFQGFRMSQYATLEAYIDYSGLMMPQDTRLPYTPKYQI